MSEPTVKCLIGLECEMPNTGEGCAEGDLQSWPGAVQETSLVSCLSDRDRPLAKGGKGLPRKVEKNHNVC